jgi:hypothetical protein
MIAAISELLTWLTGGSAPAALATVFLAVCALVVGLTYRRYLGILGADRRKLAERQAYNALRSSLAKGNTAVLLYSERLTQFLNWVDRFFGDAGMADRTLFPHAFGLRTRAPLWTAAAFHRCLFLALVYPIATIFIIWTVSGHPGPGALSYFFFFDHDDWRREFVMAGVGFSIFAIWHSSRMMGFRSLAWAAAAGAVIAAVAIADVAIAVFVAVGSPAPSAVAIAVWAVATFAVASLGAGAVACASACAVAVAAFAVVLVVAVAIGGSAAFVATAAAAGIVAAVVAVAAVAVLSVAFAANLLRNRAIPSPSQDIFLTLLFPTIILACFSAARMLSELRVWFLLGPLLLFLGLLPLLNAPFDWASLGLARALLRRGLELGGWWPYALALVDASLAAVLIAALALTMVVGVQAFDAVAALSGGLSALPLEQLFDNIAADPSAPEHWGLYALLLSTMIPSLVNLVIGGTSLVRGLPGLPSLLLRKIPERGNVPKFDRAWIATVLTAQVAAGAALGTAAQVFLVWVIIGHVMPFFGLELLGMAGDVAAFNLPARVGQLFGVSL